MFALPHLTAYQYKYYWPNIFKLECVSVIVSVLILYLQRSKTLRVMQVVMQVCQILQDNGTVCL